MSPGSVSVHDHPDRPGFKRLVLSGRVTVADAAGLHAIAVELASGVGPLVVDCTGVTHLDVAAFQVLLALGREVEQSGRRCEVRAEAAAGIFRQAGLGGLVS